MSIVKEESLTGINKEETQELNEELKSRYEDASLDESIWAPREERCEIREDIKAKVAAANVDGKNTEHREKTLRWLLRGNSHIKQVEEEFSKGNQWCIITFDCRKGLDNARRTLANKKEEYE